MNNCLTESSLNRLIDSELDEAEAQKLKAHIELCPECSRALERLEILRDGIKCALTDEANAGDLSPIWDRVSGHIADSGRKGWLRSVLGRPRWAFAYSTAAVALVFALIFFQLLPGQRSFTEAAVVIEAVQCDDPDVIVTVDVLNEDQTTVVYISGLQGDEEDKNEQIL